MFQTIAVVIPSLNPCKGLISYTCELAAQGFTHIYIVNDGSGTAFQPVFDALLVIQGCTVLVHDENRGKGAALKTAFSYIADQLPECRGVITADSDGQHAVKDVCKLANQLLAIDGALLMGGRDFSQPDIPFKSWLGNRVSSVVFFALYGVWVLDTQTGLRGFDVSLLPEMLEIVGDKFEYEMAVLVYCAEKKIPVRSTSIETIYIDGNEHSHFRPMQDSLRIAKILFSRPAYFLLSAIASFGVDIVLCWSLLYVLTDIIASDWLRVGTSVVLARVVSMLVNYSMNKRCVFRSTMRTSQSFVRYSLLAVCNMAVLTACICLGHRKLGLEEQLLSIVCNIVLFFVNYQIQQSWVFSTKNLGGEYERKSTIGTSCGRYTSRE